MTHSQFQSFIEQNDRLLLALRREITQSSDLDAATQLALEAVLIKMRVAFLEYGKQILVAEGARSAREADQETCVVCYGPRFTPVDLYYQNREWLRFAFDEAEREWN